MSETLHFSSPHFELISTFVLLITNMKKLFSWTWTYTIIQAIWWTWEYISDYRQVAESLHGDAFRRILKSYLKMNAKIDWLGRVYGVVNPAINENGQLDFNSMVFEIDGVNTNNNTWVENWLYKQMITVENVFGLEQSGFFDMISAETRHVGPENADNFLIIFDIASRKEMSKRWKRVIWQTLIEGGLILSLLYMII